MSEPEIPLDATLHVYAQGAWHDNAYIVGTRAALYRLAVALQALVSDMEFEELPQGKETFFTSDGEGFAVHLLCETEERMEKYRLPYTEEMAKDHRAHCHWPRPPHNDGSRCTCQPGTAGWAQRHGAPYGTLPDAYYEAMRSFDPPVVKSEGPTP